MPATNLRVSDNAAIAAQVVPGSQVVITGEAGNDPRSYQVDFPRILDRVPESRPQWNVERGAAELATAYRQHGLTAEVCRSRFERLPWLTALQEAGQLDASMRWTNRIT